MSAVIDRLKAARAIVWQDLTPAFDYAIMQAEQAEHDADRSTIAAQYGFQPAYPPLVLKLAESVEEPKIVDPWAKS